jgi:hypothetical protein
VAGSSGPNGAVNLLRTTTFAGYHDGVEHYVTAFEFAGGGGAFGSIVPLPDIPTKVERGGDWTLQRLVRETDPPDEALFRLDALAGGAAAEAEVLLETTIDALDITILRGGGDEVGLWAKNHGFRLPPDAPEMLDFYADRSPIFMAAAFDADAAAERGQAIGDGTPVHLTIPTDNPWVPLRILALGKQASETVEADVYLLTDDKPAMLPKAGAFAESDGLILDHSAAASDGLLADLRSDAGMGWVPSDAWLTKVVVDAPGRRGRLRPCHRRHRSGEAVACRRRLRAVPPREPGASFADRPLPAGRGRARDGRPARARAGNARGGRTPAGRRVTRTIRVAVVVALLGVATIAGGCAPAAMTVTIRIHYSAFDQTQISVPRNVPVTFVLVNEDPIDPRVADRRPGIPRTASQRDARLARRGAERGHRPGARDRPDDDHVHRSGPGRVHLPPSGPRGLRDGRHGPGRRLTGPYTPRVLRPNPPRLITVVIAVALILVGLSATVFPIDIVNQALDLVQSTIGRTSKSRPRSPGSSSSPVMRSSSPARSSRASDR